MPRWWQAVVVGVNKLASYLRAGDLGREAKVEAVAGVVLHDEQAALRAGDRLDGRNNGVGRRACEHITRHGGRQKPLSNEPGVGGFMSAATTFNVMQMKMSQMASNKRQAGGSSGK